MRDAALGREGDAVGDQIKVDIPGRENLELK